MPSPDLKQLVKQIPVTLLRERHRLQQRLNRLRESAGNNAGEVERLAADITRSVEACALRLQNRPMPEFPEELPVSLKRDEIAAAIRQHQVIVVAGETGSGKTTQLPKICLQAGRGIAGLIGCTQPRRIAARSIAARVAEELQSETGQAVGYKVRFHDRLSPQSYIKFMTDGILLAEMQGDRWLNEYDTLIIDEAHERNLNIDFILGYLKQLLPKRPDLKLVVTSATIDTARFSEHFNNAPVIEVEGRMYPVEVRYRPPTSGPAATGKGGDGFSAGTEGAEDISQAILEAVDEISREESGDILIFLPGEREIRETAEVLRKHHPTGSEILPLYARLSNTEQNKVFHPGDKRRIVLATNVAETSLTVPRIRAVIDPGVARVNRYSVRNKVQQLLLEKISQASANQRKGRCGRVGPGLCIRLYSEEDFNLRAEFTPPEILRTSLAAVILRMLDLRLGDVSRFPFIESPEQKRFNDGYKQLQELGAVDKKNRLTETGRQLARLPIDPRIGRMILAAKDHQCLTEVLIIAAALSIQDPRERPLDAQQAADAAHAEFHDKQSDFMGFVNLWKAYHEQAKHLSKNKLRRWCREHFLAYLRMLEWVDIHRQLSVPVKEQGWRPNEIEAEYEAVHRALLSGLLSNLGFLQSPAAPPKEQNPPAKREARNEYLGARGIKLHIFPGSALFKVKPKWIMAAELAETSRLYARCVAKIEPAWVEEAAGDLCRRSYSEPHWEKRRAQVAAYEQVTVYGLTVVVKRKVNYGPIDPKEARELFIRGALVEGEFRTPLGFFQHNRALIEDIQNLEHKSRRPDILIDEYSLYQFYDEHIPEGIYSGAAFEQWYKTAAQKDKRLLYLKREDLMRRDDAGVDTEAFPDSMNVDGMELGLSYRFEPGHPEDGVTLKVPVQILQQLDAARFEWLVPGLLEEKITALLRALPKALRKHFVPAPNFAKAAYEALNPAEKSAPLGQSIGAFLQRISGVAVPIEEWDADKLPAHLHMRYRVLDENDKELAAGRDLAQLKQQWREHSRSHFAGFPKQQWERDGIREWNFGEWQERLEVKHEGLTLQAWPALVDQDDSVAIRLFDDAAQAKRRHRTGLKRLFSLQAAAGMKEAGRKLPLKGASCEVYQRFGSCAELKQDLLYNLGEHVFLKEPWPQNKIQFEARLAQGKKDLFKLAAEYGAVMDNILKEYSLLPGDFFQAAKNKQRGGTDLSQLRSLMGGGLQVREDIRRHLDSLVYAGFARHTPLAQLKRLPRYIQAARIRIQRLQSNPGKDAGKAKQIDPLWQKWQAAYKQNPGDTALEKYRWLLEELRVSLFAQELGTAEPVSVQKLEKLGQDML